MTADLSSIDLIDDEESSDLATLAPPDPAWAEHGIGAIETRLWAERGKSPAQAAEWSKHGFDSISSIPWERQGFTADAAAFWASHQFRSYEARDWTEEGMPPPPEPDEAKLPYIYPDSTLERIA